jgi:hypothetical protein
MITVLMYVTHGDCSRSVESFRKIGNINPTIIGNGEVFSWYGRISSLYQWCLKHPNQKVLCVDGYDTCCVSSLEKDIQFNWDELTFSAEANCWPDKNLEPQYPQCDTKYRFLNGGVWFGLTNSYCKMIDDNGLLLGIDEQGTDQLAYTKAYINNVNISLDHKCQVCHNLFLSNDDYEINQGTYRVKSTGSLPIVVHGNGQSGIKTIWDKFNI